VIGQFLNALYFYCRQFIKYAYKLTKNVLHRNEKILEIVIYIKLVGIFCINDSFEKEGTCIGKNRNITAYYVSFGIYFIWEFKRSLLLILQKN